MAKAGQSEQRSRRSKGDPASSRNKPTRFALLPRSTLAPHPKNPRKHSPRQVDAIARSINTFGFNAPILIDKNRQIIAGHGRYEAAKHLGLAEVPVIFLEHLSPAQATAYMLADNKLTDRSTFDDVKVAAILKELSEITLDFDIEATGFEPPEIDIRVQSLDEEDATEVADDFDFASGAAVSALGDRWYLGDHCVYCESALKSESYSALPENEKAAAAFTDAPYNVPIKGHVSGKGRIAHREFPMASGEMSKAEFTEFLAAIFLLLCAHLIPGALIYSCIDWRHMGEMDAAAQAAGYDLLNLCVWVKTNAGMGSFYRSQHEFIYVFRNGKAAHLNNVQLGRFGRNRTNVWNYAGANTFGRRNSEFHPTVKPIRMVADAILDSTKRNDIVLDPFLGSGTTLLAAERTGRRCYGIELDPLYVDTAIERWQKMTGRSAHNRLGESYDAVKARRTGRL